jgi:glutaconate CoA-transferase subunit A
VETDYFNDPAQARLVHWERAATTGVVHIPGGAHPSSCNPLYGFDVAHFKTYTGYAKDEAGFAGYVEKYLGEDEADYQNRVGGLDAIRSLPLPTY